MTYYYGGYSSKYSSYSKSWDDYKSSYNTYEFTAFSEDDLFGNGGGLCWGAKFEMPCAATTCFQVSDNDCSLSGDGNCWGNDKATDSSGQTAKVLDANGAEIGNGGQVYAESYHWLVDQNGFKYLMIEIEQEGSGENYYTFHSSYGVPPSGAELTVLSSCDVSSDWIKYDCLGAGSKELPTGSITGTAWCDLDCDGLQDQETVVTKGDPIFTHSTTYESVTCTKYNVDCYGDWKSTGHDTIDLVVGGDQGHKGNARDNTIVELDKGGVWTRDFKVDMGGTYCLSLDTYLNSCVGNEGNAFKIVINGEVVDTVTVTKDGSLELAVELKTGYNEIEFVSKSWVSGYGAGIDNVNFQKLIETTTATEPTKAGVLVKLLHVDGSPVLDDNNQPITTLTDANGTYTFDDVPVGEYRIMGVAPDGKEFTIQDVNGNANDERDSDVDSNGMSGVIKVEACETKVVDLGLCDDPNEDPTATNDMGKGCADELIFVDLSDNYADADSASVAITMIDGVSIADGETKTISGLEVTRTGDGFTFDGEAAFAYLDIGEKGSQTLTYTVEDSDGGTTTAEIELTFCGDANSVDSFVGALPSTIKYKIADGFMHNPPQDFGYDMLVTESDNGRLDGVEFLSAYCLDFDRAINSGTDYGTAPELTGDLFVFNSSTADNALLATQTGINGAARDNVNQLNWILNQDFENNSTGSVDGHFSGWEVQFAIWELTNGFDSDFTLDYVDGIGQVEDVDYIVNRAIAEGASFEAGEGDIIGLFVQPNPETPANAQPYLIGVEWEPYDCLC
ncbi:SdrD B-like domain-containing protein [Pseudooceanicola sp.]|uniref:SdrD B-like domain-containing protein n=1 Tax=Pseudooceanicola sp. TaxID=1914328 RepID=UPI0035C6F076